MAQNLVLNILARDKTKVALQGVRNGLNNLRTADKALEKGNPSGFNYLVGHDINLKVDFIKYWLGSSFIDEVFIKSVVYSPSNNFYENLDNNPEWDEIWNKHPNPDAYIHKNSRFFESIID